jgi:F0F1-type ATP synthase beta subunit
MLKLKFNQNFKTIQLILNKHFKITIFKNYILINKKDLEDIIKILDGQYLKYKLIK